MTTSARLTLSGGSSHTTRGSCLYLYSSGRQLCSHPWWGQPRSEVGHGYLKLGNQNNLGRDVIDRQASLARTWQRSTLNTVLYDAVVPRILRSGRSGLLEPAE